MATARDPRYLSDPLEYWLEDNFRYSDSLALPCYDERLWHEVCAAYGQNPEQQGTEFSERFLTWMDKHR